MSSGDKRIRDSIRDLTTESGIVAIVEYIPLAGLQSMQITRPV